MRPTMRNKEINLHPDTFGKTKTVLCERKSKEKHAQSEKHGSVTVKAKRGLTVMHLDEWASLGRRIRKRAWPTFTVSILIP